MAAWRSAKKQETKSTDFHFLDSCMKSLQIMKLYAITEKLLNLASKKANLIYSHKILTH